MNTPVDAELNSLLTGIFRFSMKKISTFRRSILSLSVKNVIYDRLNDNNEIDRRKVEILFIKNLSTPVDEELKSASTGVFTFYEKQKIELTMRR